MAIDINIPSQVKNFANLAAFPVTGAVKTIYIAEDTNKTYRWTGSAYVEISASAAAGITVGTTAITSGTVGRVMFEGTGNVVQESANLFWDNTSNILSLGSLGTNGEIAFIRASTGTVTGGIKTESSGAGVHIGGGGYLDSIVMTNGSGIRFNTYSGSGSISTERMRIFGVTGNIGINTTTDAGFKFDVNGTTRFQGVSLISSGLGAVATTAINVTGTGGTLFSVRGFGDALIASSLFLGAYNGTNFISSGGLGITSNQGTGNQFVRFTHNNSNNAFRILSNSNIELNPVAGNVLIGTTTDVASSLVTMNSTTKGFLPPRMTTTQKNAIASPAVGLMVYDTTLNVISYYNGTMWI